MNITELKNKIEEFAGKARFASFTYRAKGTGELARFNVTLGAKYGNLLEKSLLELETLPALGIPLETEAREAVKNSLEKSLAANKAGTFSEDYTKKDCTVLLGNGFRMNTTDCTLELSALVNSKTVLEKGEYKTVNSRPLTIAKDKIEKELSKSKFRTFALDMGAMESARLQGEEIIFGD